MKTDREMAESVLRRRDAYIANRKKQRKQLTAGAACLGLCALLGVSAWQNDRFLKPAGGPERGGITTTTENSSGTIQHESTQEALIFGKENSAAEEPNRSTGLSGDIGKSLPYAAADLTKEAVYTAIGGLLPDNAPDGFAFESATLSDYGYSVLWCRGLEDLHWRIRDYADSDAARITDINDTENYDLALYPIPRADSVPEHLREMVDNPIFRAEELTLESVKARAYKVQEKGDSDGWRMHFSVLYGDKLVTITSKGVSPDWLYAQLAGLPKMTDAPVQNETELPKTYEEIWGGSYLDGQGRWVVCLTADTPENREQVLAQNPQLSKSGTIFKEADHSLAELTALLDSITQGMIDRDLPFVTSAALREDLNRIEVTLTDDDPALSEKLRAYDRLGGALEIRYGMALVATGEEAKE